jgi:putative transposase
MSDHVHMSIAIPPKYAVSQVVGFMKGNSAIHLTERASGILRGNISGREGISCLRRGETKG